MSSRRLIKRYANRKMYDTERSRYVTLTEVAELVRAGEDVKVIDNKTKDDLTEVTLTQALLDSERRERGSVSLTGLRDLIATGGDFLQHHIAEPVVKARTDAERTVGKWKNEAEKTVERVLQKKGADADEEGASSVDEEQPEEPRVEVEEGSEDKESRGQRAPALVRQTQKAYDEIQQRVDERVRLVVSALTHSSQAEREVVALRQELGALTERVAQLERVLESRGE